MLVSGNLAGLRSGLTASCLMYGSSSQISQTFQDDERLLVDGNVVAKAMTSLG